MSKNSTSWPPGNFLAMTFVEKNIKSSKYNHRFQKLLFIYCMSLSGCRKKPFTPYHSSYGIGQQMWKSSEIWNIIYGSIMLDNLSWSFTSIFSYYM
jgi:hypothetical protein